MGSLETWCIEEKKEYLLEEWDYEKNDVITPAKVYPFSNKRVWWRCEKGHEWQATINNRTRLSNGCPYCTNHKVLSGYNDLKTVYPQIAEEWSYELNLDKKPEEVLPGCNTKYWWECKEGHTWKATPNSRTYGKSNCPICIGQQLLRGYNDLETTFPDLVKEWNYEKNLINPCDIMPGSSRRVWWICKKGHEWQTTVHNRTSLKRNCPICAKELQTSFQEQALFYYISQVFDDALNGDRETLNGSELDIYIPSKAVAIEYDGVAWHKEKENNAKEKRKNTQCRDLNIDLIRIRENGLCEYSDCYCIMRKNNTSDTELEKIIHKVFEILGVEKIDINLDRDRNEILSNYVYGAKSNSFYKLFPELAKSWDYAKNGSLTPEMISPHSNKKIWWKCEKGHEWCVSVSNRIRTSYCPICSNKLYALKNKNLNKASVIPGYNDLKTVFPELLEEWNYEKNGTSPETFRYNSNEKVWWKCKEGHEWEANPYTRKQNGNGCPYCAKTRMRIGKTKPLDGKSFYDEYPLIANEWNYYKNGDLSPKQVKPKCNKKVWWKCEKGHEWEAKICNRVSLNRGCPYCSGRYVISGETDLKTVNPKLASEWNYRRNGDLLPEMILPSIGKRVWWKCEKGHEWEATVNSRSRGNGCPMCAGRNKKNK